LKKTLSGDWGLRKLSFSGGREMPKAEFFLESRIALVNQLF